MNSNDNNNNNNNNNNINTRATTVADNFAVLMSPISDASVNGAISNLRALPNFPRIPEISRDQSYALWNLAECGGWVGWSPHPSLQYQIKLLAAQLVDAADGDVGVPHLRFVMESRLRLALDCVSVDSAKGDVESHLARAMEVVTALSNLLVPQGEERTKRKIADMNFRVAMTKAEVYYELHKTAESMGAALEAKAMLVSMPEMSHDLGTFAYNCGVKDHRAKETDMSIAWLQLSVETFDRYRAQTNVCRSLRLLAGCFLERGELESAKRAAAFSLEIDSSALSLAMMVRVHLVARETSQVENTLARLFQAPELLLSTSLELCRELRSRNELQLALWALKQVQERFAADPGISSTRLEHVLLLQASQQPEASLKLVETIVSDHVSGASRLSAPVAGEMLRIAFMTGVATLRDGHRTDAIAWISAAMALLPSSSSSSSQATEDALARAQFHRVLCSIHLDLDDMPLATQHARQATEASPGLASSWYMMARCAIKGDSVQDALQALTALRKCPDFLPSFVYNVASLAQSLGKSAVMNTALEMYLECLDGSNPDHVAPIVSSARALVRGLSSATDYTHVARVIQLLVRRAEQAGGWSILYPGESKEGEWICKATFNAAVSALKSKDYGLASTLFDHATHVCSWHPLLGDLSLQARVLAVQCFLDQRSHEMTTRIPEDLLTRLQEHISVLRGAASSPSSINEVDVLQFRAALLRGESISTDELCAMVQSVAALNGHASPDMFERMASAAMSSQRLDAGTIASKALSIALRLHCAQRPSMDIPRCSIVARNLLALKQHTNESQQLQQLKDVIDLAKSEPSWPLEEKQWIAITVWNAGAALWREGKLPSAEKFCAFAVTFARSCGAFWNTGGQMKTAYDQLLAQINCEASTAD